MKRTVLLLGLLAGLAACSDGQPLFDDTGGGDGGSGGGDGGGGGDGTGVNAPIVIPEDVGGSLRTATYVPPSGGNAGRLLVDLGSLDGAPGPVRYTRAENLDVPGFAAYSNQEDPLDRFFLGLARRSSDRSIQGTVVQDGGQFNRYFGGVAFERLTPYSPYRPTQPNQGLVSYAGDYAGLLNVDVGRPNQTLPLPPGTDPSLIPGQPIRVTGDVFLNADFSDNAVNGAIVNREIADFPFELGDVILVPADIARNGTFSGSAETDDGATGLGTYSGAFGGRGATAVAGGTHLADFLDQVENEEERGLFVLTRCGRPGDAPICDDVNPRRNQ